MNRFISQLVIYPPMDWGLKAKKKLQAGDKLTLNITTDDDEFAIHAVVMHCTQSIGTYKIGVKFDLIDSGRN